MSIKLHTFPFADSCLRIASVRDHPDDDTLDPNFFDPDYSIATQTAFSVWEGSEYLLRLLQQPIDSSLTVASSIAHDLNSLIPPGTRVVELGSGTGVAGLGLALLGASVLLTDIATVVPNLSNNVSRNKHPSTHIAMDTWLAPAPNAAVVGKGFVAAQCLNWYQPLHLQCYPIDPRCARMILASETTWLCELVEPFVSAAVALLVAPNPVLEDIGNALTTQYSMTHSSHPIIKYLASHPWRKFLLWVYKERGTVASQTFTTFPFVKSVFTAHGCTVATIHSEPSAEDPAQNVLVNVVVHGTFDSCAR